MNKIPGIYAIDEEIIREGTPPLRDARWPLAGLYLNDTLRERYGLPTMAQEQAGAEQVRAIHIPHTHHDYSVVRGYLVPYYPPAHVSLDLRKEAQMIARSRAWTLNAMPQLNVAWTAPEIEASIQNFKDSIGGLDPMDTDAVNKKAAEFRLIVGAIMSHFESLGRAITQHNTYGTVGISSTIKPPLLSRDQQMPLPLDIQAPDDRQVENQTLSDDQVKALEKEYEHFGKFLNAPENAPFLRQVLLTDKKIDRDGVLIDLLREILKPIRVKQDAQARHIDTLIIDKIGSAMHSIDQTRDILKRAMTEGESGKLFAATAHEFILMHGKEYNIASVDDIIQRLDEYAALCKARTGILSSDATGYMEVYTRLSALDNFFNSDNGLLQSMRRINRGSSKDVADLRLFATQGTELMLRTAYTRIPCNSDAPSVWVPNLDKAAHPLERNLTRQFLTKEDRAEAREVLKEAEVIAKANGESAKERFLNKEFCSVGVLERKMRLLEATLEEKAKKSAIKHGSHVEQLLASQDSPSSTKTPRRA